MNQLRILLHDGSSLILHEDELFNEIVFVLDNFRNDDDYLTIEKDYGRELVLNKGYIVGINVERQTMINIPKMKFRKSTLK